MKLTSQERAALQAAFHSSTGNGHDFGFTEDIVAEMQPMKKQAVGALITSLQEKGFIYVNEPVRNESGTWHQFEFTYTSSDKYRAADAVEALLKGGAAVAVPSTQLKEKTMKATTTKKSTTTSNLFPFRVVVRGTLGDKRVRRVETVHATDEGAAAAQANEATLCKGLKDPYITVLPPLVKA